MEIDDWKSPFPYYIGVKLNHQKNNVSTCVFFFKQHILLTKQRILNSHLTSL